MLPLIAMWSFRSILSLPPPIVMLARFALARRRPTKRWIVMLVDAGLCAATCYAAIFLRLGFLPDRDTPYAVMILAAIGLAIPIFAALGLYREIFSQTGLQAIQAIGRACLIYSLPFATIFTFISVWGIPRTISLVQPVLLFVAIAGSRVTARRWLASAGPACSSPRRRVLIYGAGSAGRQLAGAIAQSAELLVVGYFDDDPALIGSVLDGYRIHAPARIAAVALALLADEILLALPSISRARRKQIIAAARETRARVRTLPGPLEIAEGRVEMAHIRDLAIEDLLERDPVEPDQALLQASVGGKVVLVTGAGGSIGGELCRQLLALGPAMLLLVEASEFALYEIHRELAARAAALSHRPRIVPLLGSVCDEARMEEIIASCRPQVIFHAAAYKHVPLVEHNPAEGVRTNVIGTLVLARVAQRWQVGSFVLVSTDKAVRPTNVMGATKRAAELVLQAFNAVAPTRQTRFAIVRFGNVLGSSGSVVPLFRQQIACGGPVTVTDLRATRYFMTVGEAAELVLQAAVMARGGEVFVLDMGEPLRIADLARNMIELAGFTPRLGKDESGDIAIVEIGLRPGEKLYEELLIGQRPSPTAHPRILQADEKFEPLDRLQPQLDRLAILLATSNRVALIAQLQEIVPEFHNAGGLVDWIHLHGQHAPEPVSTLVAAVA